MSKPEAMRRQQCSEFAEGVRPNAADATMQYQLTVHERLREIQLQQRFSAVLRAQGLPQ